MLMNPHHPHVSLQQSCNKNLTIRSTAHLSISLLSADVKVFAETLSPEIRLESVLNHAPSVSCVLTLIVTAHLLSVWWKLWLKPGLGLTPFLHFY